MRTLPTDMIELTRQEGDALWWACDAFFDHCGQLLLDESNEPGRNATDGRDLGRKRHPRITEVCGR